MAYPTGSGSEVLRRGAINAQGNSATAFTFDGSHITTGQVGATVPANHIITLLSMSFTEVGGEDELLYMIINDGPNDIYNLPAQPLAPNASLMHKKTFLCVALWGTTPVRLTSTNSAKTASPFRHLAASSQTYMKLELHLQSCLKRSQMQT